ncbi:MAG: DUF4160 domain-containing protein [Clostridia bacterium]|nr:DUF4160 domain-containing protein [Clostridia bacterium]
MPPEILEFLQDVFEIQYIRGRIGKVNGISFIVHTNEKNHTLPHIHAVYGEYNISIEISTGKVLDGNLPRKNQKIAIAWVLKNKENLLNTWSTTAISAKAELTISGLDSYPK